MHYNFSHNSILQNEICENGKPLQNHIQKKIEQYNVLDSECNKDAPEVDIDYQQMLNVSENDVAKFTPEHLGDKTIVLDNMEDKVS